MLITLEPSLKITKNFSLGEAFASNTADRNNIHNYPPNKNIPRVVGRIFMVAEIMQEIRDLFGVIVDVGSWYRSPALLQVLIETVGASKTSDHIYGSCVDFELRGYDKDQMKDAQQKIEDYFQIARREFDQLIYEYRSKGNLCWIHLGIRYNRPNRKQVFDIIK